MGRTISEALCKYGVYRQALRAVLPSDKNFWKVYSPIIRILKDSQEHRLIREKIGRYLHVGRQDKVLEEGCGNAIWLAEIEKQAAATFGLDIETRMMTAAKSAAPGARFVRADLNEGVPFQEGSFHKIGSILVEGYLRDDQVSRTENFRVLKDGGLLAVVTPRRGARFIKVLVAEAKRRKAEQTLVQNLRRLPLAIIAIIFGKIAELKAVIGDWHFYDQDQLKEKYRQAGFEIVACESVYADQAWLLVVRKPVQVDSTKR